MGGEKKLVWTILTLAAAMAAQAVAQQVTIESGINRKGSDYTSFRTGQLEDCRRACARDRRCQAYTYNHVDTLCYLKDRVPGGSRDARTTAGVKEGFQGGGGWNDDLSEERGIDYKGGHYTRFQARGLRDCKDQCRRDDRCVSYTYDMSNGLCYLKDRIGKRERDSEKVAGIKGEGGTGGGGYPGGSGYGELTEERGIDYKGGHYTRFQSEGLRGCKDQCRRDDRCISYTYDLANGLCYLKDRVGERERDANKIAGFKRRL